ncbi:MAG: LPS export ABC transporter periplasmic protein LptC [Pseudohongiella sp.]|nr:LPS export ABC transporter periplasmic protein LptC [Pseudohongiella sp.]MDO9520844.1 LPS export ABC transporter periplasmic protein LptC [Pseudohongiella sp.]MDP2128093.1 LPS export ABC transporter periplasmic protein LptC [Pseudohongiella sp.]
MQVKLPNRRWILALGPAVLIMWLLSGSDDSSSPENDQSAQLLPGQEQYEGFGRGIRSIIYDENGYQAYTLNASEQRQFPNQLTELDLPHMQMFDGRSELWNISAASGRIRTSAGGDILQLDLEDNVEVLHHPSTENLIRLTTDWMTIEPPTQTLFTNAPVHVEGTGVDLTAIGMFADLTINLLNFNSNIQGRYYRARD